MPRSIESEQAALGSAILSAEALDKLRETLRGDEFYFEPHARLFRVMVQMRDEGKPIDIVTLTSTLQDREELDKVGGISYMTKLGNSVPTATNASHYAGIVLDRYLQRAAILEYKERLIEAMRSGDARSIVAGMHETGAGLADRAAAEQTFKRVGDVCISNFEELEQRYHNRSENGVTGIPSGFTDLDKMTSGFQRNDLIIVAARPSVGKTAFALNIAQNVGVRAGQTVAIFSLEMSASQLVNRMISAEGNIDASRIRTGYMEGGDWENVTMAIGNLNDANIFIDDTPALTVSEIRSKCRALKKQDAGLGLILIDYLQLISSRERKENRQQEVSEISRTLKQIARELEVPVIALSQLSRGVEQRQDKRPMMSDLRESGSIEQDADIVAFLYRDDYYDKESEKKNIIEIIIAKQRNGPVGTVELAFLKNFNKFVSLDRSH
ncbi:replicative DNA helicase [Paenibacillus spongiae]|uniref:Replicative DNA helicase n=1 Tax=Paenibacillus spongiae TaxID=2909671 RepID=A0ABY5SMH7_9BACL|nr:replicative DNA helicase [Paenibacillus spongiae]UVI33720.1 replicative DNA helicase [Paenibacillus spongiae]